MESSSRHELLQRGRAADRSRELTVDLRAGLRPFAPCKRFKDRGRRLVAQVFEIVVVDLDHRCIGAIAHAFDLGQREQAVRSEEHTSELQSLMRISYAVFCLKKKKN